MHVASRSRKLGFFTVVAALTSAQLAWAAEDGLRQMTVTQAFTQSTRTDSTGEVTSRVEGAFSDPKDTKRVLRLSIICTAERPPRLSLFIEQESASIPAKGGGQVELQVNNQPAIRTSAGLITQGTLSAYSIYEPEVALDVTQRIRKGMTLALKLDGNGYVVPLGGLDGKVSEMTAACPGWQQQ